MRKRKFYPQKYTHKKYSYPQGYKVSKLVGITGNIASGKSWILNYLSLQGYKTLSSDEFIGDLYKDHKIQLDVLKTLPEIEYFDKKKIFDIIYQHKDKRERLEKLLYPYLIEEIKNFAKEGKSGTISFVEVPLLFEKNFEYLFDFIILVLTPLDLRLKRAKNRGILEEDFYKINSVQTSDFEKQDKSHFVVNTEGELVEDQINKIVEEIEDKCAK